MSLNSSFYQTLMGDVPGVKSHAAFHGVKRNGIAVRIGFIFFALLFSSHGLLPLYGYENLSETERVTGHSISGDPTSISLEKMKLPEGFSIKKVADDSLATNIYRMAVNPRGEIFVSGPGYIRRLVDDHGNGVFDRAVQFADLPQSGAQGLWCGDDFVLAVGDDGVWRFDDADRDGVADGPPQRLMKIGTAGEHFAHQIKRGPDGWWYLIAGNQTSIEPQFSSGRFSPIQSPRAGFLMRISPDFNTKEVVAHGFRNAYAFDFNHQDEIFVFDSDDEREVGLPWYRPTRLFQIQPGDDAGWVNDGWKRPSHDFDMPLEIGAAGRGSPTAVVCYRSSADREMRFPLKYRQAIFIADWTFGRILVALQDAETGGYRSPEEFATAVSPFAFGVTDMVLDSEGNLLVSVGGRQTTGAVYRISSTAPPSKELPRHRMIPLGHKVDSLPSLARIRDAFTEAQLSQLIESMAENDQGNLDKNQLLRRQRLVLQILQGRAAQINQTTELHARFGQVLTDSLKTFDPVILKLVSRLGQQLEPEILRNVNSQSVSRVAQYLIHFLKSNDDRDRLETTLLLIGEIREGLARASVVDQTELLAMSRLATLGLGDFGEADCGTALRGYLLNEPLELDRVRQKRIATDLSAGIQLAVEHDYLSLAMELGRLGAMLKLDHPPLHQVMRSRLQAEKNSVARVHWLFCLSQTGFSAQETTVNSLVHTVYDLNRSAAADRNWEPRLTELVGELIRARPELAVIFANTFQARDDQLFVLKCLPAAPRAIATSRLADRLARSPEQSTLRQLQALFESRSLEYQDIFRQTASISLLNDLSILALTRLPEERNRELYRSGLQSKNQAIVKHCAIALRSLHAPVTTDDWRAAYQSILRLGWNEQHVSVRDQLMMLFDRQELDRSDYQFKTPGLIQTEAMARLHAALAERIPGGLPAVPPSSNRWRETFVLANWESGDAARGETVFRELKCAQCHQSGQAIGPSLQGVTQRFSREDIFRILGQPSDQVSDRYRAKVIVTSDGVLNVGIPIYESVDGITIQTAEGTTLRLNQSEIESIRDSDQSLMPSGLLDDLSAEQFADLQAYLETLK
jgi:putative heme-binding domain-containing protein